jgi:hypothetical protein
MKPLVSCRKKESNCNVATQDKGPHLHANQRQAGAVGKEAAATLLSGELQKAWKSLTPRCSAWRENGGGENGGGLPSARTEIVSSLMKAKQQRAPHMQGARMGRG